MAEPTLEDLLAALQASGGQDPNAPIGVPVGYVPPIRQTGPGAGFQPGAGPAIAVGDLRPEPYIPGDDLVPASQSPERIVDLQQALVDAGILRGSFQVGVWDAASRNAYRSLLGYANQLGTTDSFALQRWMATGMGEVDPTPTPRAPFVAQVTNPDDIEREFREYLRERTGSGKIDEAAKQAIVGKWQAEQVAAQRAVYDAAETGGTVTETPSFETFAEQEAKRVNPVGFRAHEYLDKLSAIEQMLGGAA